MLKNTFKITIAGHVEHGKSTLTGRLLLDTRSLPKGKMEELTKISRQLGKEAELAYLADQLKEERLQERTIDTTQSFFKTPKRNYCVIDVPGHVEFIKNMITGATQADSAVLLIDALAGIEEQTRRHAYIVNLLGLPIDVAVFNKMDLVDYSQERFQKLKVDLSEFLKSMDVKAPECIPICAKEGENIAKRSKRMSWYKGRVLIDSLDSLKANQDERKKPLRFAVQDVYNIGKQRLAVGKVLSGQIKKGSAVRLFPTLKNTRIETIKVFGATLKKAVAGENIGVLLEDSLLASRGEIIADENDHLQPTDNFRADVFWMSEFSLKLKEKLILRCSTQEVDCVALKLEKRINSSTFEIIENDAQELRQNESGVVYFKTEKPIVIERLDFIEELGRFVLEAAGEVRGAGIITAASRRNPKF